VALVNHDEPEAAALARMGHITAIVRDQDEACDVLRAAGWPMR
jgi:hypothetical protein